MRAGNTVFGLAALGAEQRIIGRRVGIAEFAFTLQKPCSAYLANICGWGGWCAAFWANMLFYGKTAFWTKKSFFGKFRVAVGANTIL